MFKATPQEYRFRFLIHAVVFVLGFSAPWNYLVNLDATGANAHLWGILATNLARLGVGSVASAFNLLLYGAIGCSLAGALLRTWGGAYLGEAVVQSPAMHTGQASPVDDRPATSVLRDGPFRHLRNPLYLGTILHTLALLLLMPLTGAIFTIVAIVVVQVRLILAEEDFLLHSIGQAYAEYCKQVPRIIPSLRPRVAADGHFPRWSQAFAGEIYFWGVAGAFAAVGSRYDEMLLLKCVIVSFGVSLVLRALLPSASTAAV